MLYLCDVLDSAISLQCKVSTLVNLVTFCYIMLSFMIWLPVFVVGSRQKSSKQYEDIIFDN